jgi:hypothetical protein
LSRHALIGKDTVISLDNRQARVVVTVNLPRGAGSSTGNFIEEIFRLKEIFRAFSYPNWSGVSNTRHMSAFRA